MKKHNVNRRREVALKNLQGAEFFEKKNKAGHDRKKDAWQERVSAEIATLEHRLKYS